MGKTSIEEIRRLKGRARLPVLTAYDYPMARLLDELEMPLILVGDSLGMVVLGYPDTTEVTMEDMEHHVRAVARARPQALIIADLPYQTYETPAQALENTHRLIRAGADGVKAEGGGRIADSIRAITAEGIPFMGHLGMLPQQIKEEGRYRMKGKNEIEERSLLQEASLLDELGAFSIVLELVEKSVSESITKSVSSLTIGIGSGPHCDGQILVTHDLVGAFPWFTPRFVKPKTRVAESIRNAIGEWRNEVQGGSVERES